MGDRRTTGNPASSIAIGQVYRTPFEPSGLVKVIAIEPPQSGFDECAFVEFVGDHPHGYKDGSNGRYFTKELLDALATG